MSLVEYKKKRKFNQTSEPKGRVKKSTGKLEFVVQKHNASHLHYDFRLEMNGVLKSWAVPKGPSLNPEDKRLAMMVEDHPYEYRKFEGDIPKGNYGAGQVIIWDKGTYEAAKPESNLITELNKGHLSIILHGTKLKGEFALVKQAKGQDNQWLLIKKHDKFATSEDITLQDKSVVSGVTIRPKTKDGPDTVDISKMPTSKAPDSVKPMLATLIKQPFDDNGWLYEVKWDGYRALLYKEGSSINLFSRRGQSFNSKYSEIVSSASKIDGDFVIDGEVVAVDKDGKAHFEWLQNWGNQKTGVLQYMVFDILWYNGRNLENLPLIDRKKVLKDLIKAEDNIMYSDHVIGKGSELFSLALKNRLEGIMAKRCQSSYQAGRRSKDWLKIKTHRRQEVVIGGFTEPKGSRKHIGALVLGVYEKDGLRYVGHTGGGIPPELMPELRTQLESIEIDSSPFVNSFKPNGVIHWAKPGLVGEVTFSEWTSSGHMRQPIFVGLRQDKNPRSVKKEEEKTMKEVKADNQSSKIDFTHRSKVFWPKQKYTKGDLIDYYKTVSEIMLPYIKDRPHSLLRQPNGINGQAFFQKDVDHSVPDWVQTIEVYSESNDRNIRYYVCDSIDSLLYMVQLGCIEINPWNSTVRNLDKPSWTVIDLDPEDISFDKVVEAANATRTVCENLGIESYPKTSGKTGIHIFIPLGANYSYDQSRQFAELVANLVHKHLPNTTSLERSPKKRQKKIYLDFLQNRKGQTLAAPYSVRPTESASVSTPLKWEEVNSKLDPANFTIKNTLQRLEKTGDLWSNVVGPGINLKQALKKLS